VKGDVARMMFYMATRYEGTSGELDLELVDYSHSSPNGEPLHGVFSTLMEWHIEDPVDDFEQNRNDVIYSYQENRNPFIDHPEFVELIYNPVSSDYELLKVSYLNLHSYPNPFNPSTTISFDIKEDESGRLTIFNLKGQIIASEEFSAGQHSYQWDGYDSGTGLYFYQLSSESGTMTKKMLMMK